MDENLAGPRRPQSTVGALDPIKPYRTSLPDWAELDYVLRKKIFMAETVEGDGIRSKVTVKQLKAELRSRGLKVTGVKRQLIRRLMDHLSVP